MGSPEWELGFILGVMVLAVFGSQRFNSPSWARSYTCAERYRTGLILYLASQILVFCLLWVLALQLTRSLELQDALPLAVLVALLILSVLPKLPFLRVLERWPRALLHRLAGIPLEGQRLGERLFRAGYSAPGALEKEVKSILRRRGYDPDQPSFSVAEPVQRQWLRASLIYHQLTAWAGERRYGRFVRASRNELDDLRQRYERLSLRVSRTFDEITHFGRLLELGMSSAGSVSDQQHKDAAEAEVKDRLKKVIGATFAELHEDIADFLKDACLYAARGVLSVESSYEERQRRFGALGFQLKTQDGPGPIDTLFTVFFIFVAVLFTSFMVLGTQAQETNFVMLAAKVVMIAIIHVVAITVAVVPKMYFGFANIDILGRTPYGFVFSCGVVAVVLAIPVALLFKTLMFGDWDMALKDFKTSYPWCLMAFTNALLTAFLIQDNRWVAAASATARRLRDGVVMAAGFMISAYVVRALLHLIDAPTPPGQAFGLTSAIVGFLVGFVVPSSFRRRDWEGRPRGEWPRHALSRAQVHAPRST